MEDPCKDSILHEFEVVIDMEVVVVPDNDGYKPEDSKKSEKNYGLVEVGFSQSLGSIQLDDITQIVEVIDDFFDHVDGHESD